MQQPIPGVPLPPSKKRHGCFTAWLILLSIVYIAFTITFFQENDSTSWSSIANIVWLIGMLGSLAAIMGLFKWKKWGFWLFGALQLVFYIVNLMNGLETWRALSGLLSFPILYGVLQIGRENKAWPQLE